MENNLYLDKNNVAAYGWGAGGSVVLNTLAKYPNSLVCVAIVNPVTDWKAYG